MLGCTAPEFSILGKILDMQSDVQRSHFAKQRTMSWLYRSWRMGARGPFLCYKLRTMYERPDTSLYSFPRKYVNDSRMIPGMRWLRRWSRRNSANIEHSQGEMGLFGAPLVSRD